MKLELLIVDDESIILRINKSVVIKNHLHSNPECFLNGKLALEYIKQKNSADTAFLVLLDINMPIMNGWQFLDSLKTQTLESTIYVVMVTSSVDTSDKEKAKEYSVVTDYVEKPLTPASICERLFSENVSSIVPI